MYTIEESTSNNPYLIDGIKYNLLGFELTKFENFEILIQDEIFEKLTIYSKRHDPNNISHTIDIKFTADFRHNFIQDMFKKSIEYNKKYDKKELFNFIKTNYGIENIEEIILKYLFCVFKENKISYTYINIKFKDFSYGLYTNRRYSTGPIYVYKLEEGKFNIKDRIDNNYLDIVKIIKIKNIIFKYMKFYEYLSEICSNTINQNKAQANVIIVMLYLNEKKKFDFIYFANSTKNNIDYEDVFTYLRNQIGHPTEKIEINTILEIEEIITDKIIKNMIEVIIYLKSCDSKTKDDIKKIFENIKTNNIKKNLYIRGKINI